MATTTKTKSQSQSHTTYLTLKFRLQKAIRQLGFPITILSSTSSSTQSTTDIITKLTPELLANVFTTLETLPSLIPSPNPTATTPTTNTSTSATPPQPIPFYTQPPQDSESDAQKFLTHLTNLKTKIHHLQTRFPFPGPPNEQPTTHQGLLSPLLSQIHTLLTTLHHTLQTSILAYSETLKAWELSNPIEAAQEFELSAYSLLLRQLLLSPSSSTSIPPLANVSPKQWQEVETSLNSLEKYLMETKIRAQQVGRSGIEESLREILETFVELDREGVDGFPVDFDKGRVERAWGMVDKIGSGVSYLMVVDGRDPAQKATTRSIFLLKSAPPATFRLSASREEWCTKRLSSFRDHLVSIVLDPSNPIQREDESRWNSTYQALERLEEFLEEASGIPGKVMILGSVKKSKIDDTVAIVCKRLETLHFKRKAGEDEAEFVLMHVSWELAMRIREVFTTMEG